MNTVGVELPESLYAAAEELARETGVTVGQLLASSLAEKVAAQAGLKYLQARATRGSREEFEKVLSKVPAVEPEECDRL